MYSQGHVVHRLNQLKKLRNMNDQNLTRKILNFQMMKMKMKISKMKMMKTLKRRIKRGGPSLNEKSECFISLKVFIFELTSL